MASTPMAHLETDNLKTESAGRQGTSVKGRIAETAKLLSSRADVELDEDIPFRGDDDDDSSTLENDQALADIHYAATQRRDLDRSHIREARLVEPVYGKESVHAIPVQEEISQKEMMWRMVRALSKKEDGDRGTSKAALEKKIRRLHANGKQALTIPLPAPVQGRLERASAYEGAKDNISKRWTRIVQKNRKAKQLVFPLNRPGKDTGGNTASIVQNFKPETDYEEEIDSLLKEAGVSTDKDVLNQEEKGAGDLESAPVTKDEILKRRRELAKIRSLMFHYEHKMKRIKKIKSKKYRRVMKKEKEKLAQGIGDSEDEETRVKKAEQRRVEERMTLRHKNTSKWVRRQLQRKEANRNPTTRVAIEEQLRLHEELRRRQESEVNTTGLSDDEGSAAEGENEDDLDDKAEAIGRELMKKDKNTTRRGVMGMRFMQEAQERKRKEALSLLNELSEENYNEQTETSQAVGRQSFQGMQSKDIVEAGANLISNDTRRTPNSADTALADSTAKASSHQVDSADPHSAGSLKKTACKGRTIGFGFTTNLNGRLSADSNPWLSGPRQEDGDPKSTVRTGETSHLRGTNKVSATKDAQPPPAVTSENKSLPSVRFNVDAPVHKEEGKKNRESLKNCHESDCGNAQGEESGKAEIVKLQQPDGELLRMQDISHAFAGIGGAEQAEFEAAKQLEVERGMPTARSLQAEVLPGWGSWDGAGMPTAKRRRVETPFARAARERLEAARANAANKRSDRAMRHVILNEKRVKQATDLTLSSVPFPFTSKEQWQREVGTSICRELMSTAAYSEAIRRRVVAKPGRAIEPIKQTESDDKSTHRGKRAIIDLRKERSHKRSRARRGLLT